LSATATNTSLAPAPGSPQAASPRPVPAQPTRTHQTRTVTAGASGTPRWLRLNAIAIVLLAAAAAILGAFAVSDRQTAVGSARSANEPVLISTQTIYTSLSDADTTAAGAFLAGRVAPAALQDRYQADLARASAGLTSAARQAGSSAAVETALQTVAIDLPVYSGLISTAQADNALGYPVGASYQGEASHLMRTAILPAASNLYRAERGRLGSTLSRAVDDTLIIVALVVLAATLITLLWFQVGLSRRFRRTLNLPMLAATLAVVILAVWLAAALPAQSHNVHRANRQGSTLLGTETQARILALQARADDELTLVTRDTVASYQQDYQAVAKQLDAIFAPTDNSTSLPTGMTEAATQWRSYQALHQRIRAADGAGDLPGALTLASGAARDDVPAVADRLDADIGQAIDQAQATFTHATHDAEGDLTGLVAAAAVLCGLAALLVLVGVRPRIDEFS
jgi:hypothetical protein